MRIPGTERFARRTTVTGPGRNFSRNPSGPSMVNATAPIMSRSETAIETGMESGRCLASYTFWIAHSENASAPSPYTVSVG